MKFVADEVLPNGIDAPGFKEIMRKISEGVRKQGVPMVQKMLNKDFVEYLGKENAGISTTKAEGAKINLN